MFLFGGMKIQPPTPPLYPWVVLLLVLGGLLSPGKSPAWSQVLETFADSNITTHPTWFGDTSKFKVLAPGPYLQLQAPAVSGQAWLGTESRAVHNGRWEIRLQLRFNPSSSNQMDWYLMATDSQPQLTGRSYLLRIGGSDDNLTFYYKSGNSLFRIGSLAPGWLNRDSNPMAVRIERYLNGVWYFWADSSPTATSAPRWQWLGDLRDSTLSISRFTGIHSQYTSTRSTLFSWYYFQIQGQPIPDSLRPRILSWDLQGNHTIRLLWNESMDSSQTNGATFTWVEGGREAGPLHWIGDTLISFNLWADFPHETPQNLRINGLRDLFGNPGDTDFVIYHPVLQHGRLVITEIMSDPDPPVWPPPEGLPPVEYVELYNPGPVPIQLKGFRLRDQTTSILLPSHNLYPNETVVLVPRASLETWHTWEALQGNHYKSTYVGLEPWPNLNNDGDRILLESHDTLVLDTFQFDLTFWKTPQQKQGGWSLAKINPRCPCADTLQWTPSIHPRGGDPGAPMDTTNKACAPAGSLVVEDAQIDPNGWLVLRFGTAVHCHPGTRVTLVLDGLSTDLVPDPRSDRLSQSRWALPLPLHLRPHPGQTCLVQCKGWLACNGDTLPDHEIQTGIGIPAKRGDVLITEVYPRPRVDAWPWIEVCNRSGKVLDASRVWVIRTDLNGQTLDGNPVGQPLDVWLPGMCYVLTRNPRMIQTEGLKTCESNQHASRMFRNDLPPLPGGGAFVELQDPTGQRLDRISYHDSSYHPLVQNPGGLSLERPWGNLPYTIQNHPHTVWWTTPTSLRAGPGCYPNRPLDTSQLRLGKIHGRRPSLYKLTVNTNEIEPSQDSRIRIGIQGPGSAMVSIDITDWTGKSLERICQNMLADSLCFWYWHGNLPKNAPILGVADPSNRYQILRLYWEDEFGRRGWDLVELYKRRS